MKNRIEEDLHKILLMLADIEKRNKDPRYHHLIQNIRASLRQPLAQICEDCNTILHERDGHYCKDGTWK